MKQMKIVFLILHYGNASVTISAVDSVKALEEIEQSIIVIVDNASPNGSGHVLKEYYYGDNMIDVILLSQNIGFSRGNNAGYSYVKEHYIFDFCIVMNNDVLIKQKNFIIKLYQIYEKELFYVAGPDIYVPQRDYHASPLRPKLMSDEEYKKYIIELERKLVLYSKKWRYFPLKMYIIEYFRESYVLQCLFRWKRKIFKNPNLYTTKRRKYCILEGSCIIFTKKFCDVNDKLFYPETFLYVEEDILTRRCVENGWSLFYMPELQIWHTEHGSTYKKESYKEFCHKKYCQWKMVRDAFAIYERMES